MPPSPQIIDVQGHSGPVDAGDCGRSGHGNISELVTEPDIGAASCSYLANAQFNFAASEWTTRDYVALLRAFGLPVVPDHREPDGQAWLVFLPRWTAMMKGGPTSIPPSS
jgi:hypothetical protein